MLYSETVAMLPISFFILVLPVASAVSTGVAVEDLISTPVLVSKNNESSFINTATANISNTDTFSSNSSAINATSIPSTVQPSTNTTGDTTSTHSNATQTVTQTMKMTTTPKPAVVSKVTKPTTKGRNDDQKATVQPKTEGSDNTGIIILVIIILAAVIFSGACYLARKRGRNYSVDFTSRPDETNIPLSAVEPEAPADTLPYNGVQTFERAETSANELQEPEEKPEPQEEQKAEPEKSVADPSAESAAPPPDGTEDEPKADAAEQQESPSAPVETNMEDKTDDEGAVSNETSVESLKETNENNSNGAEFSQKRDLMTRDILWEVPLK